MYRCMSCLNIYVKLLQSNTEEYFVGDVIISPCLEVYLDPNIQVEQDTPSSSSDILTPMEVCSVGVEVGLGDLDSVLV